MQSRIVETDVRPAGAPVESYANGSGEAIPARLLKPSAIVMQPRNDGSGREWRNEVGDLVLMNPTTGALYLQRAVRLNWHVDRGDVLADLDANIPGLDVDASTGEVISPEDLVQRVKAALKAGATSRATASSQTAGAVVED